jgi:hypothetical protein
MHRGIRLPAALPVCWPLHRSAVPLLFYCKDFANLRAGAKESFWRQTWPEGDALWLFVRDRCVLEKHKGKNNKGTRSMKQRLRI